MRQGRSRGVSLIEVLVASSTFVIVMMIGLGTLQVVKRAGDHLRGRSEPRQQLRTLLGHLQRNVRAACFVFEPSATVSFGNGASHTFEGGPPFDPVDPDEAKAPPANDLIYALAETAATEPQYTVQSLFLQPDGDIAYPGSHRMVLASVGNLVGSTPGTPADIPLGSLPASQAEVRTFATASPADGLRIRHTPTGDGLAFEFVIGHRNQGEKIQFETYQTHLTMRNNR